MKTINIFKYIFLLMVTEILLFMVPLMIDKIYIFESVFFTVNAILSWYYIKEIEKLYYKKYDKFISMLYNVCPLIGIVLLFGISYYVTRLDSIYFLASYYIPLYVTIYIINLLYIIYKNTHKS